MKPLIIHSILGYQFWLLFQALAPMIWFYPMNELKVSGYEALAMVLFSPFLLYTKFGRFFFSKRYFLSICRLIACLSILSFHCPSTLSRLIFLVIGLFFQMLVITISFSSSNPNFKLLTIQGTTLGLLLFISSRIWLASFVPAWWSSLPNLITFIVCLFANIVAMFNFPHISLVSLSSSSSNSLPVSMGFGSLIYLLQALFGEVSLVTRWTVKSYPNTGPLPYPWSILVFVVLWVGIFLSPRQQLTKSYKWWLVGSCSLLILYFGDRWIAFSGGLVCGVYLFSLLPNLLIQASHQDVTIVMPCSMFFWLVEMLFSVWTVAYNFVPGGTLTRERTPWLLFASIFLLFFNLKHRKTFPLEFPKRFGSESFKKVLLLIFFSGLAAFCYRTFRQPSESQTKNSDPFTCGVWTFHFGYDNQGWPSLERGAQLIRDLNLDVVALLESDASKPFLGNHDLGMWLSEELNMYLDFGPSTRDHTWGTLLLSKFPIVNSTHHLLPSPHGELAPALSATLNVSGNFVDILATHMGNDGDDLDRKLQAKYLSMLLKQTPNPIVFLGYVTSEPYSRDYRVLTEEGFVEDINPNDLERWCEYIFFKNLTKHAYARVSHGGLSDTELQAAKFSFQEKGVHKTSNDFKVTKKNKKDSKYWFPNKFGGYTARHSMSKKNHYHMNTPLYFI